VVDRLPFGADGVPTQTSEIALQATASAASVVARRLPSRTARSTSSPIRSSTIGARPALIMSALTGLTSTPTTSCPIEARQAAETHPT
jgi:hypothetical protein